MQRYKGGKKGKDIPPIHDYSQIFKQSHFSESAIKQLKESEERFFEAKTQLDKYIALSQELENNICTLEQDKESLLQALRKAEVELAQSGS